MRVLSLYTILISALVKARLHTKDMSDASITCQTRNVQSVPFGIIKHALYVMDSDWLALQGL
jgi:hypothetical protein